MITIVVKEGMWGETALISITPLQSATTVTAKNFRYQALTSDITITEGDKEFDQIVTLSGARLNKLVPQGPIEITMTMWPSDADMPTTDAGIATGAIQMFDTVDTSWDTSDTVNSFCSRNREVYRVIILWTDDTTATDAYKATAASTNSLRYALATVLPVFFFAPKISFPRSPAISPIKSLPMEAIGSFNLCCCLISLSLFFRSDFLGIFRWNSSACAISRFILFSISFIIIHL